MNRCPATQYLIEQKIAVNLDFSGTPKIEDLLLVIEPTRGVPLRTMAS
jgi:hypothetical protein